MHTLPTMHLTVLVPFIALLFPPVASDSSQYSPGMWCWKFQHDEGGPVNTIYLWPPAGTYTNTTAQDCICEAVEPPSSWGCWATNCAYSIMHRLMSQVTPVSVLTRCGVPSELLLWSDDR